LEDSADFFNFTEKTAQSTVIVSFERMASLRRKLYECLRQGSVRSSVIVHGIVIDQVVVGSLLIETTQEVGGM
jgi:hypothetical protein